MSSLSTTRQVRPDLGSTPEQHGELAEPRTNRRSPAPAGNRLGIPLAIVMCAQLMIILDATVVNIALPGIAHGLQMSATGLSWVLNAYSLTFGGLLLLGGRAGDILGRRRMFL